MEHSELDDKQNLTKKVSWFMNQTFLDPVASMEVGDCWESTEVKG